MRPPPTTAEIVEVIALREPDRTALWEETSRLTYGELHGMLVQCALRMQRLGVRRGHRVAVAGPGIGVQMVVLLAAEGLGALTASFLHEDDVDAPAIFGHADWVFAGAPQAVPAGVRFQPIDEEFVRALAQPLAGERPAWSALAYEEPQRLIRTSGSSGRSRLMVMDRGAFEHWLQLARVSSGIGTQLRLLMLGPLVVHTAYSRSSACLRAGGLLMIGHGRDIAQLAPTRIWGLPLHLERLLRELPAGYVSPRTVGVDSVGGLLSAQLRAQVQAAFGGRLSNRYGLNEASSICDDLDAGGVGVISAGADVRIEDGEGNELPPGVDGVIVVRTPALVRGYLDQPEDTARVFRDGWFVTADIGAIVGWRRLRLAGRQDELVNIGGLKIPAAQLEATVRGQPGIADCAMQAVHLEAGRITVGVALVLQPGASVDAATRQLQQALPLAGSTVVRVMVLDALPALATGKVDRMALLRLFQARG
ncbi:MAG TPA: class I adenylate-forming enzyme family protein [Ramlibacter sp.]